MKTLILLFLLLWWQPQPTCLKVDVLILADYSLSVEGHENYIRSAMQTFVSNLDMEDGESVQVAAVGFNTDQFILTEPTFDKGKALAGVSRIVNAQTATDLASALMVGSQLLFNNSSLERKRVIVLITDGEPDDKPKVQMIASQLQSFQVTIWGVYINNTNGNSDFLKSLCSPGGYLHTTYSELNQKIKQLDICL